MKVCLEPRVENAGRTLAARFASVEGTQAWVSLELNVPFSWVPRLFLYMPSYNQSTARYLWVTLHPISSSLGGRLAVRQGGESRED